MKSHVFISPHLDDAVFSVGGLIKQLASAGETVRVLTVFTQSVPSPTGFALACQTSKGISPDIDYMALRRDEDLEALRRLGVDEDHVAHLGLPEAPHRGYDDASMLFGPLVSSDSSCSMKVADLLIPWIGDGDHVYLPAGFGRHVDHRHVIRAAIELQVPSRCTARFWHDTPYVFREPEPPSSTWSIDITGELPTKIDACAAYASQLNFQFGGESGLRAAIADRVLEHLNATPLPF